MTLDEAIRFTRERIIKEPTAEFPFLEELEQCAEAREIATRNALTGMLIKNADPVTSYLAALAMGIQIGVTWGKAEAELAALEQMFGKQAGAGDGE